MKRPLTWLGISLGALAICGLLTITGAVVGRVVYYFTAWSPALPPRVEMRAGPSPPLPDWLRPGWEWWQVPAPRDYARWWLPARLRPVVVTQVIPDSPAEEAGLEPQDVIIAVDGKGLDEHHELPAMVRAHKPGDDLTLTIVRANHELEVFQVEVTLEQRTNEQGGTVAYLGLRYRGLLPNLRFAPPSGGSED